MPVTEPVLPETPTDPPFDPRHGHVPPERNPPPPDPPPQPRPAVR